MELSEKVKKGLECCTCIDDRDLCVECPYNGTYRKGTCITALEADNLSYIRELEAKVAELEKPLEPMTWEEAVMDDFFLEIKGEDCVDGALNDLAFNVDDDDGRMYLITHGDDDLQLMRADYGKTWRAWSRRPTDEERKAAEWDD